MKELPSFTAITEAGTGALLCDDMGLGKTVQVIAMMVAVLHKTCTKSDVLLAGPYESHELYRNVSSSMSWFSFVQLG